MWIIAGLGNPGSKYSGNRHNVGFKVIDRIAEEYDITLEEKDIYVIGKGVLEGIDVILLKPLTFMNRSGLAVKKILRKKNFSPDKLIVVQDDLDLAAGIIKIRKNGSSGGHRGIESVIQETGTKDFIRVKVGIGRDNDIPVEKYVLMNFRPSEKVQAKDGIIKAAGAVVSIAAEGIDKAMNRYNRSAKADKSEI
ncbi:MAG: aminoacyl-tRNA hydrolase [Nitrospirae bacterium GWC2_46_6]|nr:MAG: aminoacyl-tRNA hydrolase [Nitrospirae bacterium GWC2_46_6]OGW22285.1 MAG: aminoacyl-tRNA hydrolase [Nitrospirae bacterium GWA2_46_11]OGW23182.1 MAG: aminoacyl-tRNA hydrolase [Nitrospirae bacterium GWB2_47_37]HAK87732.1 aminoacyl-tRNA hydrolase [Nitrospiraceae bacterium]HCZ11450.1 aminoacyl-tRNA hydrolase [Nitrospiraceae bacterium]